MIVLEAAVPAQAANKVVKGALTTKMANGNNDAGILSQNELAQKGSVQRHYVSKHEVPMTMLGKAKPLSSV